MLNVTRAVIHTRQIYRAIVGVRLNQESRKLHICKLNMVAVRVNNVM